MAKTEGNLATLEKKVDVGTARLEGRIDTESARNDERFKRVDERFDDVDRRFDDVDRRFDDVDRRFDRVDARFDSRFDSFEATMKASFDRMDAKFDAKFDALHRLIIQVGGGLVGTLIVALVTVLATH